MLSNIEEGHPIIILSDVSCEDIKSIIEFVYRGELSVSAERVASVLEVARELKIRGLMEVGKHVLDMENEDTSIVEETPTLDNQCSEQNVDKNLRSYEEDSQTIDIVINDVPEDIPDTQETYPTQHLDITGIPIEEKLDEEDNKRKRRRDSSKKNYK